MFWLFLACVVSMACPTPEPEGTESRPPEIGREQELLREALTFHASFDAGPNADFALGDPRLYTAPSSEESNQAEPGIGNPEVEIVPGLGRFGSAFSFNQKNTTTIFYRADKQVAYSEDDWSGTVSFWLSLTPGEDLEPGYCDPIQITDQAYNDAAIWVDFTNLNPRQFRLGVFGDLQAWNPQGLPSDQVPGFQENLVVVEEPPFRRGDWTHVVITHSGLGSASGGTARLYLNGQLQGVIEDIEEPFTWDLSRAQIRIGVNLVGLFDELALFNRPLTETEVKALHELDEGVVTLRRY
jgi:hypothetical protein